ncbi:MAG TPA: photosynthetic reaction center cytochrome c subunit family protein [Bryobacteraceae bacterium]|nr:photosynthetic reaction center cytochrome c subunit family protein [Bryobacteraceae bacterium]
MKLRSIRLLAAVSIMTVIWLGGVALPQAHSQTRPNADQVFKNIQALKDMSVDDFIGSMGVMSAALGFCCNECHTNAGTDKVDWAADTPRKVTARKMVNMVTTINRTNFAGAQVVTCWTCHRGRDHPATTPALEDIYGPGPTAQDDVLPAIPGQPSAAQIFDKYIQAVGGAQRLAAVTSYVAKGSSVGFGGFGGGGQVQIFAKFPDQHTTLIEFKDAPDRGDSIRTYNGQAGWIKTPLTVLGEYEITGTELDGARLDAQLAFPGQIKQIFTNLRVSLPTTISDLPGPSSQTASEANVVPMQDRRVQVVQGSGPRGLLATLFFDQESGLLLREVRYSRTPIGRVPTQMDFADYRDVGGIKMPFRLTFAWLDGRDAIQLSDVQTNVAIDAKRFGRPATIK